MAKVMNTKWFLDKHAKTIEHLYEARIEDFNNPDINNPLVMKALTELRLYRLPPYFLVPTSVKGRIQAQSAPCYDLDNTYLKVERELTQPFSPIFYSRQRHEPCTKCGARRASKDGVCYKCIAKNQEEERELSKTYNNLAAPAHSPVDSWISPKTLLLANLVGCVHCGVRNESNIWHGELDGWGDGLCPECLPKFPLGKVWSLPKTLRSNTPFESYGECQICLKNEFDYAVWGHCEICIQDWQDQFIDPKYLYGFVEEYGALAALLVRSSAEWINYLKDTLQHKYCWNAGKGAFPADAELVPFHPDRATKQFNIKDMVEKTK